MDWSIMFNKRVVVLGCGNTTAADDGIGPAIIAALEIDPEVPEHVGLLDAGTSVRSVLFDLASARTLLADEVPCVLERLIMVDAITDAGRQAGEVFEVDVDGRDRKKKGDVSFHQFPTINLLKELRETAKIDVKVIAIQITRVPEFLEEGLSPEVAAAIPKAVALCKKYF